ncbi:hypothetical protein ABGB12_20560 [Actinocorallia sp. B10E7]|uniref:hypothetical protein n=1 Tax=Actinocorallia sp. B10E7 TaxID=3153558 RepID=UPI00325C3940
MSGYTIDHAAAQKIVQRLTGAADDLNDKAGGAPPPPDAGVSTGPLASVPAALTESLGETVEGIDRCAAGVVANGDAYLKAEITNTVEPWRAVP